QAFPSIPTRKPSGAIAELQLAWRWRPQTKKRFPENAGHPRQLDSYLLSIPPFEYQRRIRPAEPERIRQRVRHLRLARLIRNVIQIAFGMGGLVVNSGA